MRQLIFLHIFMFVFYAFNYGQDKDIVAQMHYTTAEEQYNSDSTKGYFECIKELAKAEEKLGTTNAKIMDLKTRAWAKLVLQSKSNPITNLYMVDTCMQIFFELADPKQYPQEKYLQIINLKNEIQSYKELLGNEYAPLYQKDCTQLGDIMALYDLYKFRISKSVPVHFLQPDEEISATSLAADTLKSLFEYENKNFYALPFKTGNKGGSILWYYVSDKLISVEIVYRDKDQQMRAIEAGKQWEYGYTSYNYKNAINLFGKMRKNSVWPPVYIQMFEYNLEPDTEYYIWLASRDGFTLKETKSVPVFYSIYLSNDASKTYQSLFDNKHNNKNIRSRGYENNEY